LQIVVVEVDERVEQRPLVVGLFYHGDEFEQRVAEGFGVEAALCLDVDHRDEVLLGRLALGGEVAQLESEVGLGPEKVV